MPVSYNIKATKCDLTTDMQGVIESRLNVVDKFVHGDTQARCEIEVEKTNDRDTNRQYRGEANLTIDGKLFRAEAYGNSVETAFDEVQNELKKELRRSKDKEGSMLRRGGRRLKDMLRFGR